MSHSTVRASFVAGIILVLSACGGSDTVPEASSTSEDSAVRETTQPPADASPVADACSVLDKAWLTTSLKGANRGQLDFQEPIQTPPSAYCEWKDVTGAFAVRVTIEDSSTAETDDHSERAYNIDVDPTVAPQDGPGDKAVVLIDTAFASSGSDPLAYGYFFVAGEAAVFIETVGLDIGEPALRLLADEVHGRLTG